jgi:hypothetical protein
MELSGGVRVVGALAGRCKPSSTPLALGLRDQECRQCWIGIGWVGGASSARRAAWYGRVDSS